MTRAQYAMLCGVGVLKTELRYMRRDLDEVRHNVFGRKVNGGL